MPQGLNFVHDPATLYVAYCRVGGNRAMANVLP
jgi:hypothetical protein